MDLLDEIVTELTGRELRLLQLTVALQRRGIRANAIEVSRALSSEDGIRRVAYVSRTMQYRIRPVQLAAAVGNPDEGDE